MKVDEKISKEVKSLKDSHVPKILLVGSFEKDLEKYAKENAIDYVVDTVNDFYADQIKANTEYVVKQCKKVCYASLIVSLVAIATVAIHILVNAF